MARPMSTEQLMGVPVCEPVAVMVMREELGSLRYCSFRGFCKDLISIAPPKICYAAPILDAWPRNSQMESSNSMDEWPERVVNPRNELLTLTAGSRFGRYEILGAL